METNKEPIKIVRQAFETLETCCQERSFRKSKRI